MPDGFSYRPLGGMSLDPSGSTVHTRQEQHPCGSIKPSGPNPPDVMVLLPSVFDGICREFGQPPKDLFVTQVSNELPLYVSPVPDPLAWKQDALHLPWNHLEVYTLPPLLCQVILWAMELEGLKLLLVAPL